MTKTEQQCGLQVKKGNDLVEAQYDLSLVEMQLLFYAACRINKNAEGMYMLRIGLAEFFEVLGVKTNRYTEIKKICEGLVRKVVKLGEKPNEIVTTWLASIEYMGGEVELEFSHKLAPYLLQLGSHYTYYEYKNIAKMTNKYSIRIYELLKQYKKIGSRTIQLEDLRKWLQLQDKYPAYKDLNRRVLQPALEEINAKTDLLVSDERIKNKRTVVAHKYTIAGQGKVPEELKEHFDFAWLKKELGIYAKGFDDDQLYILYNLAVDKVANIDDVCVYEYMKLNIARAKQEAAYPFNYLQKGMREDYAKAVYKLKHRDVLIDAYE